MRIAHKLQTPGESLAEVEPVNVESKQLMSIREQNAGETGPRWSPVEAEGPLIEKRAHMGDSRMQVWETSVATETCEAGLEVRG